MSVKKEVFGSPFPARRQRKRLRSGLVFFSRILFLLLFAGCAGKPWGSLVADHDAAAFTLILEEMQRRDESCFSSLDAKVSLTWDGPGGTRTLSGYLQLLLPGSIRFVLPNPLGQPAFVLVSNGQNFQSINTALRQQTRGSLLSLAREHHLPATLLSDRWGYWLMGRIQEKGAEIDSVHQDGDGRGVWFTTRYPRVEGVVQQRGGTSHLLINPDTRQLLVRILVDETGETAATLSYEARREGDGCGPAGRVTVTDLPYNSSLLLDFAEVLTDRPFSEKNFSLKVPDGYALEELR
jgi:hypothetical protein